MEANRNPKVEARDNYFLGSARVPHAIFGVAPKIPSLKIARPKYLIGGTQDWA